MEHYTHVVWDFNGTLFNDVKACIKSANRLLERHGLPLLSSVEDYRAAFGFPIIDYYRRLGFDFEKTPYADLAVEWVAYYLEQSATAVLYPDVTDTLRTVRAKGISQLILSATEKSMLEKQIESLGILPYLDEVLGLDNIHAYSKRELGVIWRDAHPNARLLFVGDTDHDAQVAAAMGADCILVTTGHQPRTVLESLRPLAVVDSLGEICEKYL
ncbi:MAG: HAD family hydrolase [Clostridia bacterium]|nr:HAD family hydrolase [Clostridia bacterium]